LSLSIDDFKNDFEINVIGAVRPFKIFTCSKKGADPNRLFSTVAAKLGMPFHASIATKAGVEGLVKSLGLNWLL
jgi:NAD(P)-dependent dehydrogenase (short-subunit alcohol dehydrogenase family)